MLLESTQTKISGNILFIILICIVVFAGLTYAVTQSTRGGGKDASDEIAELEAAKIADYTTLIQNVALRLQMVEGCTAVDYTAPENQPGSGDFSCHIFHPDGGAVPYMDFSLNGCDFAGIELTDLEIGEGCGNIIYAGEDSHGRLYYQSTDLGAYEWASASGTTSASVLNSSDGKANTDFLLAGTDIVGYPFPAAAACRSLGEEWFLPSHTEVALFCNNVGLNNRQWTSSMHSNGSARRTNLDCTNGPVSITYSANVRCARRD